MSVALAALALMTVPTSVPQQHIPKDDRIAWFREARFGMFIHWGLYAVPAGEWEGKKYGGGVEWIMEMAGIPVAKYEPLKDKFNPVKYDAAEWVRIAKDAGMKYIVITSKHHDGFALWDSKTSDYDVMATPYRKDILKPLAEECRKQGIKLGFYHSIMDWHHPDYGQRRSYDPRTELGKPDMDRYTAYMKAQLKELLTEYGDVACVWFDGEWESPWTHERGKDLYNYVLGLAPKTIVNNRVDKGRNGMQGMTGEGFFGDYGTHEQEIPRTGLPGVDWESCMTMNGTWGFSAHDLNWKSSTTLIQNLSDIASKGGNYLLNVGPTAEGEIPPASVERLAEMGKWLDTNGEAIYGTKASPFARSPYRWTQKKGVLYLHLFNWQTGELALPGIGSKVTHAQILGRKTREAMAFRQEGDVLTLNLTGEAQNPHNTVIRIDYSGEPKFKDQGLTLAGATLSLPSGLAAVHGTTLKPESGWLGFWTDQDDWASWDFEVKTPGRYDVELEMAVDNQAAGSEWIVLAGGTRLTGKTKSTGGWRNFQWVKMGTVVLTEGDQTLIVRPGQNMHYALMNLRGARLSPTR